MIPLHLLSLLHDKTVTKRLFLIYITTSFVFFVQKDLVFNLSNPSDTTKVNWLHTLFSPSSTIMPSPYLTRTKNIYL